MFSRYDSSTSFNVSLRTFSCLKSPKLSDVIHVNNSLSKQHQLLFPNMFPKFRIRDVWHHENTAMFSKCSSVSLVNTDLAAMPPWRRLETRGLPSLSMPPDTVRPRVVPSFLISSTVLVPLNSSVKHREGWGGGSLGEVGEEEQRQEMRGLQEQRRPAAAIPHSPLNDCDWPSLTHSLSLSLSVVLP